VPDAGHLAHRHAFADLVEHGRFLSESIPGAQFVTFPGADMLPWAGEFDGIVDEIEEFFTGGRRGPRNERILATVLFVDIVDSTVRAAAVGDRRWRNVLDEFDVNVQRLLARYDGVLREEHRVTAPWLVRRAGPGVRCAMAMVETAKNFGIEIRAGLHVGEIELRGDDIGGLAVHIASRVSALAEPGEVLRHRYRARSCRRIGHRLRRPGSAHPQGRSRRMAAPGCAAWADSPTAQKITDPCSRDQGGRWSGTRRRRR
jgi:class 3 adenylate cyclase